jgi:hypothetical protein
MMTRLTRNSIAGGRLAGWLVGAFLLTILSFLIAAFVSERRAQGIFFAANEIVTDAAPSIQYLSSARTNLRHFELALDDFVDVVIEGKTAGDLDLLQQRAMDDIDRDWEAYTKLPSFPGETGMWGQVTASACGSRHGGS